MLMKRLFSSVIRATPDLHTLVDLNKQISALTPSSEITVVHDVLMQMKANNYYSSSLTQFILHEYQGMTLADKTNLLL